MYALVLLTISPLLQQEAPHEQNIPRGQVLKPVWKRAVEKAKQLPHAPGQIVAEGMAGVVKKKLQNLRHDEHLTDKHLMELADQELKQLRGRKVRVEAAPLIAVPVAPGKRTGFMVLGMHRSGTSMLTGLMATGMGYVTGGPLIGGKHVRVCSCIRGRTHKLTLYYIHNSGAYDNVKGFFERLDVVYQNDEFMNKQSVWWNLNVVKYDTAKALKMKEDKEVAFTEGKKALAFFNDPNNSPWIQKDPRQCITLKTWLPLMSSEPAILFTFRHPLEVAQSLKKREPDIGLDRGLRLWILYNKAALENSRNLCVVYSSNEAILAQPLDEIKRLSKELTEKCGVPKPPQELTQEEVNRFVDPSLQHNTRDKYIGKKVIEEYNGCKIHDYDSDSTGEDNKLEHELYMKAMKIFCDLKTGKAQKVDYAWPELEL
jgi:hypothetical protein